MSRLAVASFVLALLWLYWVGTLLSAVFAWVALRDIRRSRPHKSGRGLAITALIVATATAILTLVGVAELVFPSTGYLSLAPPVLFLILVLVPSYLIRRPITIKTSTHLDAPADAIFAVLVDPHELAALTPGRWATVGESDPLESGGFRARIQGCPYGTRVSYTAQTIQCEPPHRLAIEASGVRRSVAGKLLGLHLSDEIAWTIHPGPKGSSLVSVRSTWRHAPIAYWCSMSIARHQLRWSLRHLRQKIANTTPNESQHAGVSGDTP